MTWMYAALVLAFVAFHYARWRRTGTREPAPDVDAKLPDDPPTVSFLVPAWNARDDIPAFVDAFASLSYPNRELICAAGGEDGSLDAARERAGGYVTVLEQRPGEGKQGALRTCYQHAVGDIVFLTDIDCRPDDDTVQRTLRPILDGKEAVVSGSSRPVGSQRSIPAVLVHWATVRTTLGTTPRPTDGILGRNCAATRGAIEAIGGFDFPAPTGTDYRMAQALRRVGQRVWLEPYSEIPTEFAWPLRVYVKKRARWLRNVLMYAERPRQNGELIGAYSAIALPIGLLAVAVVGVTTRQAWPVALIGLALVHGIANRLHSVRAQITTDVGPWRLARGAVANLAGTLAAGLYAVWTWTVPSLRERW